jgi:hypothetical protein
VAIVTPVLGIFAPGVGGVESACRQRGFRQSKPIRPPPQAQGAESSARSPAVSLALVGFDSAAPECDRDTPGAGAKNPLRWPAGPGPDVNNGGGRSAHSVGGEGDFPTAACSCILTCSTSRQIARQRFAAGNGGSALGMAGRRLEGSPNECRTLAKFSSWMTTPNCAKR